MAYHAPAAPHYIPPRGPKPVCRSAEYYRGYYWAPGVLRGPRQTTAVACYSYHRLLQHHYCWEEAAAAPAADALATTVPVTTASRNITTAGRRLLHPLLLRCPPQSPPPVATSPAAASAVHCGCPAPQAARGEGRVSAHTPPLRCKRQEGEGCVERITGAMQVGRCSPGTAPTLPLVEVVLQVRVFSLTWASVASASRHACPACLRLCMFCKSGCFLSPVPASPRPRAAPALPG